MDDRGIKEGRWLIGDLVFDPGKRQVGRNGRPVKMPKLSYQLFAVLAESAPNVVTHEELIDRVWDGRVVSPDTIMQRVKLLRDALGDDANAPRYVALVRGEGYRLIPEMESLPEGGDNLTRGLVAELGRRRVLQVALVYAAVAWSITEVVSFLIEALPVFPAGSKALVAIIFVVGFPVAMFLAWRFDIGPDGIQRTQAATRAGRASIAAAVILLAGATAGLFYLIYPKVVEQTRLETRAMVEPDANTIAVLPFDNASNDPEDLYISEGIGDELRDQLGRVEGLRVAARSSSRVFAAPEFDALAISQRLGVAKLVEGSLRREGEQLRVTVQIIDGATGFQLWTGKFDKVAGGLLATQQAIALEVTSQLLPELGRSVPQTPATTAVESAHDLMLVGRHYFQQVQDNPVVDIDLLTKSIDIFRQATIADPTSAIAHSRLGAALLYLGDDEQARSHIFQARKINPDLSEVQYTLGLFRIRRLERNAGEALERAIQLNPSNVDALSAFAKWTWSQGNTNGAKQYFREAMELDPMSIARYADIGNFYGIAGYEEEALEIATSLKARFSSPRAFLEIARIHETVGNLDIAIVWALRAKDADPAYRDAIWMLAELYSRIHDFEAAKYFDPEPAIGPLFYSRKYKELIDFGEDFVLEFPHQTDVWYQLGRAYVATGQYDGAIYALESAGIPENVYVDSRRTTSIEAMAALADAYKQKGNIDRARELGRWLEEYFSKAVELGTHNSWWVNQYLVCSLSILDKDEKALESMQNIVRSTGMAWYPVIMDQPCFKKYAGESRYEALIDYLEGQKTEIRERLPDTLARMQTAW